MAKKRPKRTQSNLFVDHVATRHLSLVDEFGTERASLLCRGGEGGTDGFTVFRLNGDDGSERVNIQVDCNGVNIQLSSKGGAVGFGCTETGAGLGIYAGDRKQIVIAEVACSQTPPPRGLDTPCIVISDEGASATIGVKGVRT